MKKRLRKKLCKGEFKEMGFYIRFRLPDDLKDEDLDAFLEQFLSDAIEANGLDFGGGGHHEWQGFAVLNQRGSATEENRMQVDAWLKNHPSVIEYEVSELRDAWYDSSRLDPFGTSREDVAQAQGD